MLPGKISKNARCLLRFVQPWAEVEQSYLLLRTIHGEEGVDGMHAPFYTGGWSFQLLVAGRNLVSYRPRRQSRQTACTRPLYESCVPLPSEICAWQPRQDMLY